VGGGATSVEGKSKVRRDSISLPLGALTLRLARREVMLVSPKPTMSMVLSDRTCSGAAPDVIWRVMSLGTRERAGRGIRRAKAK
jgi:hypothetical protein